MPIMVDRWSSSSYRHRRRINSSGGGIGKQYFVLPFLSILIISMANTVMAESVEISPNTRQKLGSSSTTYKHKHGVGAAVRRIVYFQPRNIERSLQGNNVSAEMCAEMDLLLFVNVDSTLVLIVNESTFSVNLSIIESKFGYETVLIIKHVC